MVVTALAGCAANPMNQQGVIGPASTPMSMSDNDMMAMCDMHKKMMREKTPEEQKSMMNEHMKNMPPEMAQQHMTMMRECK